MHLCVPRGTQRCVPRLLARRLSIDIGATAHPHPRKRQGDPGEDAHVCSFNDPASSALIAVADGVGAVSGPFARELMRSAALQGAQTTDPAAILHHAWHAARPTEGRSTACVCVVGEGRLSAVNLGDSAFRVIQRSAGGRLCFAAGSVSQQHSFNFPYQLGVLDKEEINSPVDAHSYEVPLDEGGAVVICATDGLFDALFPLEILELVHEGLRSGTDAQQLSARLADGALELSREPQRLSPAFVAMVKQDLVARSREAQDDITVVVAIVGQP